MAKLAIFADDDRFGAQRHRNVKVAAYLDAVKFRRRDADNFKRMPADRQRPANHGILPGVLVLPERMADDRTGRVAIRTVILGSQQASERRLNAQRLEKLAAHPKPLDIVDFAARRNIKEIRTPGKNA